MVKEQKNKRCRERGSNNDKGKEIMPKTEERLLQMNHDRKKKRLWVWKQAALILTAYSIFRSLFYIGFVPTGSMEPALHTGSFILAIKIVPEIKVGDVIVFEHDGALLVKRVAYGAGEEISVCYIADKDGTTILQPADGLNSENYLVVPEGCVYVLGDNQDNSFDSRYWDDPFVRKEDIRGLVILPWV